MASRPPYRAGLGKDICCQVPSARYQGDHVDKGIEGTLLGWPLHHDFCKPFRKLLPGSMAIKDPASLVTDVKSVKLTKQSSGKLTPFATVSLRTIHMLPY